MSTSLKQGKPVAQPEVTRKPVAPRYPKVFKVNEWSSFFEVEHIATGKTHPMGDGVDTLFTRTGKAMSPGAKGFVKTWEKALNSSPDETTEAYFPELLEEDESPDIDAPTYSTFLRSARSLEEFANAEKIEQSTGLTLQEAQAECKEFNDNRSVDEIEAGTKMEFQAE